MILACSVLFLLFLGPICSFRAPIVLGNQVLRDNGFLELVGYRLAILTNPTGVFQDSMELIVDSLTKDPRVQVVAVLSPEHGFRGDQQAETGDPLFYIDKPTGLPVFSAYNMTTLQLSKMMNELNIEAVLVDMQDVGVRLYTFIWTMFDVMEAVTMAQIAAHRDIRIVITDRPNPLGGELVDGPLVDMSCCRSGYGKLPIPYLHGMTIGELGLLFGDALNIAKESLLVVPMKNWYRSMSWTMTKEMHIYPPWIPPSPNLPTVTSAHVYGATVFLEATTAAEGRGTTTPFLLFGAPFLDAEDFSLSLNDAFGCAATTASGFRAAYFEPTFSKYNGTVVPGTQWLLGRTLTSKTIVTTVPTVARASSSPFADGIRILCTVRDQASPRHAFAWDGSWFGHPGTELVDMYAGTPTLREMIDAGVDAEYIISRYQKDVQQFLKDRQPYLLYASVSPAA